MKLNFTKQAAKYYEKAPKNLQEKYEEAFMNILSGEGDICPMAGEVNVFRYKMFQYRIIFTIEIETETITIIKIGPRGDVYKK